MAKKSAPKAVKINPAAKRRAKGEIFTTLAGAAEVSRKQVAGVFDAMGKMIAADLSKNGPGIFVVPGLMKVQVVRKKAVPARKGINPFTKEETTFKAKPARNVVKIRPLKNLKDMV